MGALPQPALWLDLVMRSRRSRTLEYGEQRLLSDGAVRARTSESLTEQLTRAAH